MFQVPARFRQNLSREEKGMRQEIGDTSCLQTSVKNDLFTDCCPHAIGSLSECLIFG